MSRQALSVIQDENKLIKAFPANTTEKKVNQQQEYRTPQPLDGLVLEDFELSKSLGHGRFGRVVMATHKATSRVVALKILWKKQIKKAEVERHLKSECEIQFRLQHPNIIQLHAYFQDAEKIYFVLECCPRGNIYNVLQKKGRFTEVQTCKFIKQLTHALIYLHERRIIHRDIKPENLLLTAQGDLKLADFGWCCHNKDDDRRLTFCGTLDYVSPEMADGQSYDASIDVWSLGILMFEFLCGEPPFAADGHIDTYKRIRSIDIQFPSFVSTDAQNLILKLLCKEPTERLPLKNVLLHDFITKYDRMNKEELLQCIAQQKQERKRLAKNNNTKE